MLSDAMKTRCTDYLWSQPLHEVVVGYFVASGSPLIGTMDYDGLVGTRICRPAGYYTFDLEQKGLSEPAVTMVTGSSPEDCLTKLVAGEADVVSLNVALAEGELGRLGLMGDVAEIADLADILTLHVLSHRTNPFGRTYLTQINQGLREMRESGEWFDVVARHLAEVAAGTQ
jgi:polar amino acid transport system substrate-binding protein